MRDRRSPRPRHSASDSSVSSSPSSRTAPRRSAGELMAVGARAQHPAARHDRAPSGRERAADPLVPPHRAPRRRRRAERAQAGRGSLQHHRPPLQSRRRGGATSIVSLDAPIAQAFAVNFLEERQAALTIDERRSRAPAEAEADSDDRAGTPNGEDRGNGITRSNEGNRSRLSASSAVSALIVVEVRLKPDTPILRSSSRDRAARSRRRCRSARRRPPIESAIDRRA